ncbi:hypothetical protein ACNTMW_19635 [Planosporangium sp. 12N6]|uniref:hypothetical protein n=1 Tax=Planosporangium spinosum TaxID=3402278 RepID=UPI003CEA1975
MRAPKDKTKHNIVGAIILGLILLPAGVYFLNRTDVTCGTGQSMRPGDICEETRKGRTTSYTYEERQAYWQRMGWFGTGAGVVALGAGGWLIVRRRRTQAAEAEAEVGAEVGA